jgi:4-carboxymuconolactone decarboxylase
MRSASQGRKPPEAYREFVRRYPKLGECWEAARQAEEDGPLDERTSRLVKLGVAIGAFREGAAHSAVRKALAAGASAAEVQHVIALAASIIGLPSSVAAFGWLREELGDGRGARRRRR